MGQFYIKNGMIRFICDCSIQIQPIIDENIKIYKCERCNRKFTNPFHKSNPYNIEKDFMYPPNFDNFPGIEIKKLREIVIILLSISILIGLEYLSLVFLEYITPITLQMNSFIQTMLIVIITLISLVGFFTIFGKDRIRELNKDYIMDIQKIIDKYSNNIATLCNYSQYKFDIEVLDGLKADNIENDNWFYIYLHIDTLKILEERVVDNWFKNRILPLGLILSILFIIIIPFSSLIESFFYVELTIFLFLLGACLIEVVSIFNYLFAVADMLGINFTFFYYRIFGKRGFFVSRVTESGIVTINQNKGEDDK